MKSMKKILVVSVAIALTVLVMACGEEDHSEQMIQPSPQQNAYSYNQGSWGNGYNGYNNGYSNYNVGYLTNGYQSFPCSSANGTNINIDYYRQYPSLGQFLNDNPQAVVQFGMNPNDCYRAGDLYGMYNRYYQGMGQQAPWDGFNNSPFAAAQIYGYNPSMMNQSRGRQSYNTSTSVNSEWIGLPDFYNQGWGNYGYPGYGGYGPTQQGRLRFRLSW